MCGKASGVRSRAKADRRSAAALAVAAAALLGSGSAHAVVYDLAPSAGFGITNNAQLTPMGQSDEFSVVSEHWKIYGKRRDVHLLRQVRMAAVHTPVHTG